jgi:uncharacterized protein (DUF2235 family)
MKNIVVCLDGTGNEVKAKAVTNVFKVAQYVDLKDPTAQVLYYDPGVGTMAAPGAWTFIGQKISLLTGLALGHGMLAVRTQGDRRSFPIEYLGIYDTVKATRFLWRDISWPYTLSLPNVRFVRHAISIDEKRRKYAEYRVVPNRERYKLPEDVREVWFAGVHSDVGGGFVDNPELGKITMRWMLDGAITAGLVERPVRYRRNYSLNESDATKDMHVMPWYWRFAQAPWYWLTAPWRPRPIRDGETIHSSVKTRMADKTLNYAPQLPDSYKVDDEPWTGPPPKGAATAADADDPEDD